MANLDFYATIEDHKALLEYLFEQSDVRVFESYSMLDRELREFTKTSQVLDEIRDARWSRHCVLLQLWVPTASTKVEIERIALSIPGHAFRYRIGGWGLMQLYLSKETEAEILVSHFGHFNQRGAEVRSTSPAAPSANPGTAADWDWAKLLQVSRRIQYRIKHELSETSINSRPVLRDAALLMRNGYRLVPQ